MTTRLPSLLSSLSATVLCAALLVAPARADVPRRDAAPPAAAIASANAYATDAGM